jgi:CRISPR-associated protein Csb1
VKEQLEPVAGAESVFFPPTFAPPEDMKDAKAGYIIDRENGASVCLVDSVGSQANRLEPLFKQEPYSSLVPQITIQIQDRTVNLLDVGHRAADAVVRSTALGKKLQAAFSNGQKGDMVQLAKIAPTSLVFGAWDSRDTQAKLPRLIESTIRAYDVQETHRAAQFFSSVENSEIEALFDAEDRKNRKLLSKAGYLDSPSGTTHGGVIARKGIVRTTIVNLVSVRAVSAPDSEQRLLLQRYVLGLALVAALAPAEMSLRAGCLLVGTAEMPLERTLVYRDGRREACGLDDSTVLELARSAALAFGVGESVAVTFDAKIAKQLIAKAKKE